MFIELHNCRSSNGFGVNPINYQEIYAYAQLYSLQLEEWEIGLIKRFDNVALAQFAKQAEQQQKKSKKK